jgi:predicted outer membrane repeat protein
VTDSAVTANPSSTDGGGIGNFSATLTLTGSTLGGNSAADSGGGIYTQGTLTVSNSTLSANSATSGDGISGGMLTVNNSTVAGNSAFSQGGGLYGGPALTTRNTIVAGNRAPTGPDVFGNLGSQGYNLISNPQDMTGWVDSDILHVNPLLGPLQDNGGPTQTMALLAGSPALNAGDPNQAGIPDQRGVVRSGGVNIGAFQASAANLVVATPATATAGVAFDVSVAVLDMFGQLAVGYTGTITFSTTDGDPGVVLPADYTFQASDGGFVTFAAGVTLFTSGDQTLTVTDTVSGLSGSTIVTL